VVVLALTVIFLCPDPLSPHGPGQNRWIFSSSSVASDFFPELMEVSIIFLSVLIAYFLFFASDFFSFFLKPSAKSHL
jgi:hypothetical protein